MKQHIGTALSSELYIEDGRLMARHPERTIEVNPEKVVASLTRIKAETEASRCAELDKVNAIVGDKDLSRFPFIYVEATRLEQRVAELHGMISAIEEWRSTNPQPLAKIETLSVEGLGIAQASAIESGDTERAERIQMLVQDRFNRLVSAIPTPEVRPTERGAAAAFVQKYGAVPCRRR